MGLLKGQNKLTCIKKSYHKIINSQIAYKSHKYWLLICEGLQQNKNSLLNLNRQMELLFPN